MIEVPAATSNEDTLSELRESCSSTISANITSSSCRKETHKPVSSKRNSYINDIDDWDFFDTDDEYDDDDEFAADATKQVGEAHKETKKDQKEEEESQDDDLNSRERRKQIIDSALNLAFSPGQKITKSPVPTQRRNRRSLGDHLMTSPSALSNSSNHSPLRTPRRYRRSLGDHLMTSSSAISISSNQSRKSSTSRKSSVIQQDSKLVASQLRAQQKHERSKRPSCLKGRRRSGPTSLSPKRRNSLRPGGRDNIDSSDHSTATIKAHKVYTNTSGQIAAPSYSPSPQTLSRNRLESLRKSDGPNMTKLVLPLTMEMDSQDKEDIPSSPDGEKSSKTKLSSTSMALQKRFDGESCTVKNQLVMQKKKESRDRKRDIHASLDKYLNE